MVDFDPKARFAQAPVARLATVAPDGSIYLRHGHWHATLPAAAGPPPGHAELAAPGVIPQAIVTRPGPQAS